MLLFEHKKSAERVLTPAESPEGVRLAADSAWGAIEQVEDTTDGPASAEVKATPARRSTSTSTSDKATEG